MTYSEPQTAEEVFARARAVQARRDAGWPSAEVMKRRAVVEKARILAEKEAEKEAAKKVLLEALARSQECALPGGKGFVERISVAQIKEAVSRRFRVRIVDMDSPRRFHPYVRARQAAMYLAHELTSRSYPEIARLIGGRDHTTILHGVKKTSRVLKQDEDALLSDAIADVREELTGQREPQP